MKNIHFDKATEHLEKLQNLNDLLDMAARYAANVYADNDPRDSGAEEILTGLSNSLYTLSQLIGTEIQATQSAVYAAYRETDHTGEEE